MYYQLLRNKDRTAELKVHFRAFEVKDADEIVRCIFSEYQATYFKQSFYNAANLIREHNSGHIKFLVAETAQGDIAGMLALKRFLPRQNMCEIASEIFKPEYRGYGMAWPFFLYGMGMIDKMMVSAAYCLPVLFHDITQRLMERLGLMPCGFIFGAFYMPGIKHSYQRDDNLKHPQGIMIQKKQKQSVGVLYLPREQQDFVASLYSRLGVEFSTSTDHIPLCGNTELFWENDSVQKNCAIYIDHAGRDLQEKILFLKRKYTEPAQTFNIFVDITSKDAVVVYEMLCSEGFFFAGIQPLCSKKEFMVMNNPGSIDIDMDSLVLTPSFCYIKNYVKQFYLRVRR